MADSDWRQETRDGTALHHPSSGTDSTDTDERHVQHVRLEGGGESSPEGPIAGPQPGEPAAEAEQALPPLRRDDPIGMPPDGLSTRPDQGGYCYVLRRMRRSWREADRRSDREGRAADLTIGSTRTRRNWSEVLHRVMEEGAVIRIRHHYVDEPALLVPESAFRELEARARSGERSRVDASGTS